MAATILLVDGDSSDSSGWKAFLQNQGYTVVEADNGRRALEECPVVQPDLVLLNASLPDMQGFQVCQQLKRSEERRVGKECRSRGSTKSQQEKAVVTEVSTRAGCATY